MTAGLRFPMYSLFIIRVFPRARGSPGPAPGAPAASTALLSPPEPAPAPTLALSLAPPTAAGPARPGAEAEAGTRRGCLLGAESRAGSRTKRSLCLPVPGRRRATHPARRRVGPACAPPRVRAQPVPRRAARSDGSALLRLRAGRAEAAATRARTRPGAALRGGARAVGGEGAWAGCVQGAAGEVHREVRGARHG